MNYGRKLDKADDGVASGMLSSNEPVAAVATDIGPVPDMADASLDITWGIEVYANVYLAHVHKLYPFLHEESIRTWMRTCSRGQVLEGNEKGFILRILCSIGAFMCSSFAEDCPHLREATWITHEALNQFQSGAMQVGPVVRSQVCILRLLHAIYGPSPEPIHEALASALAECAQLVERQGSSQELRSPSDLSASENREDPDEHIKRIVLAAHQLNEIIASGWDQQGEDRSRLLGDRVSVLSSFWRQHVLITPAQAIKLQ